MSALAIVSNSRPDDRVTQLCAPMSMLLTVDNTAVTALTTPPPAVVETAHWKFDGETHEAVLMLGSDGVELKRARVAVTVVSTVPRCPFSGGCALHHWHC